LPAVSLVFLLFLFLLPGLVVDDPASSSTAAVLVASPVACADLPVILLSCLDPLTALKVREGEKRSSVARRAAPSERISARVAHAVASGATVPGRGRGHEEGRVDQKRTEASQTRIAQITKGRSTDAGKIREGVALQPVHMVPCARGRARFLTHTGTPFHVKVDIPTS